MSEKSYRVYLRQSQVPELVEVCRKVVIPKDIIPIVNGHLSWLIQSWMWDGSIDEKQGAINAIATLMSMLTDSTCEDTSPPPPPPPQVIKNTIRQYQAMAWELMQMWDFDIEDYIRVKDGKLQLNIDNCDGCDWTTIWDLSGGNAQRTYDNILDDAGKLIDDAFKDVGGFDTPTNIPNKDNDLKRCAKATGFSLLLWEYMNTFVDTWDTITPDYTSEDFSLSSFANGIISGIGGVLGLSPLLIPVLGVTEIGAIILKTNNDAIEDVRTVINDNANLQKFTCFLYKHMTTRDRLVGEDVANIIEAINAGSLAFSVTVRNFIVDLIKSLPITKTAEFVDMKRVSSDCGCPDAFGAPDISTAPPKPVTANWTVEADFKTGEHGVTVWTEGFSDWGSYVPGTGFVNGSHDFEDVQDATQFLRVQLDWGSLSGRILRVDYQYSNAVQGRFASAVGTPDNDVEKFLTYIDFEGQNRIYAENGNGWHSVSSGASFARMGLWALFGYQEVDSGDGGLPSNGQGTLVKMRIHGTGTQPGWFASNGWVNV